MSDLIDELHDDFLSKNWKKQRDVAIKDQRQQRHWDVMLAILSGGKELDPVVVYRADLILNQFDEFYKYKE